MKRLLLAGGGHAQLAVLHALARARPGGLEACLVTPSRYALYSGMLPGWIAGHYPLQALRVDLAPLCAAAGVTLIEGQLAGLQADRRRAVLGDGRALDYDLLSLDVGSEIDLSWFALLGDRALPVRPLAHFVERWSAWRAGVSAHGPVRLAVVVGGAAGFELALAARTALRQVGQVELTLVAGDSGLLPGHAAGVRRRAQCCLERAGIVLERQVAAGAAKGLLLADGRSLQPDLALIATGGRAPAWLAGSGLVLDERGFVAVDACHRSLSHAQVFAAGDVCGRTDVALAHSGVHAVHAGPVLAHNLLASLSGGRLRAYRPRRRSLYLLACGAQHAIVSWGGLSAEGGWAWRWKDAIDRRFIARQQWPADAIWTEYA
ncbi:FAD-dependent oxidoreductase [Thermomonas sp. S9]|uniref:FAD-dependent oxidoreductase n=1 Tax=Thermomonas sp. S9 TaxID=2885203 RepID=UPI00216AC3C9|nr:FAD-dependent oxidoreductase [Thermomonas sp. S9]MCR6496534.1 FAD-dependent oxidoreductase [Thermomonas sp. S9]